MSLLLRGGLIAVAILGAFAGGYFLRPSSTARPGAETRATPTEPAMPRQRAHPDHTGAKTLPGHVGDVIPPLPPAPSPIPVSEDPPPIVLPPADVRGPGIEGPPPVDFSDPAVQMIKKELGIRTTVLDRSVPLPAVLADAQRGAEPPIAPIGDVPPPMPMVGSPMPRLGPPTGTDLDLSPPTLRLDVPAVPQPVRLVNRREIELDFEITKACLSRITATQLWATRDAGATWQMIDRMGGGQSPFRTRLANEGMYGFRLVFEAESGVRTPIPNHRDAPDLVMELDATPPQISIYPPTAAKGGNVRLHWSVVDKHPDPSSVRLEYSADGQSWHPINRLATLLDSNWHEWTLPPGLPSMVFFRVTARDKAGNSGTAITSGKMSVDLVAPAGKVTGLRVQGAELEKGPMPRSLEN